MVLGIITAVLLLLECAMFILKYGSKAKELYTGRGKAVMLKVHEIVGFALLVIVPVHLLITWKLLLQRPVLTYITGFLMLICIILTAISFLFRGRWKKWRTVHHLAAGLLLILAVIHVLCGVISFGQYNEKVHAIEITDMSAAGIPDGSYTGVCDVGYIYAKVRVKVSNGKITDIKLLEHRNERGSAAEQVVGKMVQQQNVHVDTVTSATNSSRVIMRAAENALESAKEN